MTHRNKLISAITINLLFSALSAILLLLFAKDWGKLFGVSEYLPFRLVGIGLLGFAALLYFVRRNAEKRYVIMVILADIGWVMGSLLIIHFDPFYFTETGMWITSLLAAIVLWIAALQLIALTKTTTANQ